MVKKDKKSDEEDVMRTTVHRAVTAAVATLVSAAPAFAAPANSEPSGLLAWSFLGFCAVIVVAQVMPALMMIVGAVKGLLSEGSEAKAHH